MRSQSKPRVLPAGCEILLRRSDLAAVLGISIRSLSMMLATGKFPKADLTVGSSPRWRLATYNGWVQQKAGG